MKGKVNGIQRCSIRSLGTHRRGYVRIFLEVNIEGAILMDNPLALFLYDTLSGRGVTIAIESLPTLRDKGREIKNISDASRGITQEKLAVEEIA